MSAGPSRSLNEVIDRCFDDITAGRRSVAECLAAYPEHRTELEPLLRAAAAVHSLPRVPERAPDPARRAAFMAELARTPQQSPRRRPHLTLPRFDGFRGRLFAFATVAAPAAAVAAVALVLVLGGNPAPASASTLTIFAGGVEQERDGAWLPVADGVALAEGACLRTTEDRRAMLTFADGTTVTLAPTTELVLARVQVNGVRDVILDQLSGSLWNDVVSDPRTGAHYVVRAHGVVTTVTGTVFETVVTDGETAVTTAAGRVEVAVGGNAIEVGQGESVRATASEIRTLAVVRPAATLRIDAPYAASLIAASGAATGVRPDGVSFSQIAGATTSDPASGPQRIDLLQATPGDYTLVLRPFADGSGVVIIEVAGNVLTIPVSGPDDVKVQLRVAEVDGEPVIELLRREDVAGIVDAARERVVETRRTTAAVPVAAVRAAATPAPPSATATPTVARAAGDNGNDNGRRGSDDDAARPRAGSDRAPRAVPTATPTDTLDAARARLRAALGARDRDALQRVVAALLADDAELPRADAVALIVAEGLRTRTARARVRALITGDGATAERLRAALGEAALGELARPIETLLDGTLPLRPQPTAKPDRDDDGASAEPTATPGSRRSILPRLGSTPTATPTAKPTTTPTTTPTATPDTRDSDDDGDASERESDDEDSKERSERRSSDTRQRDGTPALAITDRIGEAIAVATTRERAATDRATDKAAERATDRASEKASDRASDRATDGATDRATDKAPEKATDKAPEKATDKAPEKATDRATRATDRATRATDRATRATDRATEKATKKASDQATDEAGDTPAPSVLTNEGTSASGRAASAAGSVDRERECRAISDALLDQSIGGRGKAQRLRALDAALRSIPACTVRDSGR